MKYWGKHQWPAFTLFAYYDFSPADLRCTAKKCGRFDKTGWELVHEVIAAALNIGDVRDYANYPYYLPIRDETLISAFFLLLTCELGGGCDTAGMRAMIETLEEFNDTGIGALGTDCGYEAIGECRPGAIQCGEHGLACVGGVGPVSEICGNGLDDDCDGAVDNPTFPGAWGELCCPAIPDEHDGEPCGSDVGACVAGTLGCVDLLGTVCVGEVRPAREIANGLDDDCDGVIDEPMGKVIFLNRAGGTYLPGTGGDSIANTTPLVTVPATLPAFAGGDAAWASTMACVTGKFGAFDVVVTDVDPGPSPHVEVVVGGDSSELGYHPSEGYRGVAEVSCLFEGTNIAFAFSEQMDLVTTCEVTAHEAGHLYGLDHEVACDDIMSYGNCGPKTFQDAVSSCGEFEGAEHPCHCGGDTQNSYAHLVSVFDPAPPAVAARSAAPALGGTAICIHGAAGSRIERR